LDGDRLEKEPVIGRTAHVIENIQVPVWPDEHMVWLSRAVVGLPSDGLRLAGFLFLFGPRNSRGQLFFENSLPNTFSERSSRGTLIL
jgi:hypothetical protein